MLKKGLKSLICKLPNRIGEIFYHIYTYLKYIDMRQKKCKYGEKNKDKTFYIIRPRIDDIEGLMSLLLNVMKQLKYAEIHGFIPVVDFQNYNTQYKDEGIEEPNVWKYYFKQTSEYDLEEVYNSSNVILSGLNALIKVNRVIERSFETEIIHNCRDVLKRYIRVSEDIYQIVEKEVAWDISKTVGLYLRGTDYVKLKPAGHPRQPTFEQARIEVDKLLNLYGLDYIFLVTEDEEIYQQAREYYQEKLKIVSFDKFVTGYEGKDYLSKSNECMQELAETPYQRGLNYLVKLLILSKCRMFVGGNTCGSWAACVFSKGYEKQYVFELGKY